jgi:hypothetical protein
VAIQDELKELQKKFLEEIAGDYGLSPAERRVFLRAFDYEQRDKKKNQSNEEIAEKLGGIQPQTIEKHKTAIYGKFSKSEPNKPKGCPNLNPGLRGPGQFEILFDWLWTIKFPESQKKQDSDSSSRSETSIDWHPVWRDMLDAQQKTQEFRRQVTGRGLGHEVNIYVPLGLVKPERSPRRDEKFSPSAEQGMQQYELNPKEIEKRYEYEEFLQQVIDGEGKNLAIIGEPGAGKTTWLEQIAFHLVGVKDALPRHPICISLGNLQGKTLEEYLLQIWLSDALRFISPDAVEVEVTPELEKQLKQLFTTGKVWLLLDGVDEMTGFTPQPPLIKGGLCRILKLRCQI